MSYVWGAAGPAFEYPTCYRTENRFLTLRAATLFLLGLALLWLVLSDPAPPQGAALLRAKVERGSWVPHLVAAIGLVILGVMDAVAAARQQQVRLGEGQPAPLTGELSYHVSGASPGAGWLLQAVKDGRFVQQEAGGPYRRLLRGLARHVASAPNALQTYAHMRLAQLLFLGGAMVVLGLTWLVAGHKAGWPLAAMLLGMVAVAQLGYSRWISSRVPGPLAILIVLLVVTLAVMPLAWFAGVLPQVAKLNDFALPQAVAVLLVALAVIEAVALMAARAQLDVKPAADVAVADDAATIQVDAARLMQEIDSELVRRWVDGVPNRRYVRRGADELKSDGDDTTVMVLEESQPTLPANQRERLPAQPLKQRVWLVVLVVLGLALTATGGVVWVRMASALLADAASPWAGAATALALVLAGGYAVRAGHLVWSRIEVESTLYLVRCGQAGGASASSRPAAMGASQVMAGPAVGALNVQLRTVRAVSVFFAAADHTLGSRRLLRLAGDPSAAQSFVKQVQGFATRALVGTPAGDVRARGGTGATGAGPSAAAAQRGMPRFCPACGTPVLQGARFCQHCGNSLMPT